MSFSATGDCLMRRLKAISSPRAAQVSRHIWFRRDCDSSPTYRRRTAENSRGMDSVIVTGASRGIGLAIADRLARDGFQVVAVARRDSEELTASAARLAQQGLGSLVFR